MPSNFKGLDTQGPQKTIGTCFVMQPFDGGTFDQRFKDIIEPAIRAAGLEPYRVDKDPSTEVVIDAIELGIRDAVVCLAEITTDNPNVWYELGYATACEKQTCMICCTSERTTAFPFDIRHRALVTYQVRSTSDFEKLKVNVTQKLQALLKKRDEIGSLATLKPTTQTKGLGPHEVAVLVLIASNFIEAGVSMWSLKNDMTAAGYTEIATGIALTKLHRANLIEYIQIVDERGDPYRGVGLTPSGADWIVANESSMELRKPERAPFRPAGRPATAPTPAIEDAPEIREDDIPF